jgi:hypothetical protein
MLPPFFLKSKSLVALPTALTIPPQNVAAFNDKNNQLLLPFVFSRYCVPY